MIMMGKSIRQIWIKYRLKSSIERMFIAMYLADSKEIFLFFLLATGNKNKQKGQSFHLHSKCVYFGLSAPECQIPVKYCKRNTYCGCEK